MGVTASGCDRRGRPWNGTVTTVTCGHRTVTGFGLFQPRWEQQATTGTRAPRDRCDCCDRCAPVLFGIVEEEHR